MKFHDFLLVFGEFSRGVENFALFFVFDFNFVFASESYHFEDKKSDRRVNFRVISKQNKENHKSENIILPLISVMKISSGDNKINILFFLQIRWFAFDNPTFGAFSVILGQDLLKILLRSFIVGGCS